METDRWDERKHRFEQKMEARKARWEDRMSRRRYHSGSSGIFFGAIVVAIGFLLLLDNLRIVRFHDVWQYWPVLLVAWGVSRIVDSRAPSGWIWGGVVTLVGAFFLLDNLGILDTLGIRVFDWEVVWPVLLIAFGVSVLVRAVERQGMRAGGPGYPSSPVVGTHAFFGDNKSGSDTKDFQGGQATAVCGAARFDLRNASMTVEEAIIDVNVIFGEVEVRVPETWAVMNRAAVIFAGVNDKTNHPAPDPSAKTPRLVITGAVVFGGITLRN
jgi:predicted membrane protein